MDFYRQAGRIIQGVELKKVSVKSGCLNDRVKDKKRMYRVVCETLKNKIALKKVLENTKFFELEPNFSEDKFLILVLVYDLLFRNRGIEAPKCPIRDKVNSYKGTFKTEFQNVQIELANSKDLNSTQFEFIKLPKYIRVNTLKTSLKKVLDTFIKQGYKLIHKGDEKEIDWTAKDIKYIKVDEDIENLIVLPHYSSLYDHPLLVNGSIIIQDKASCMPACVLNPPVGSDVIDGCAAPGNKTSQLAIRMQNKGNVIAFDRDRKRLGTLERLMERIGVQNVTPTHQDFLSVDVNDPYYHNVEYVLMDPSCSGSGIVDRLDNLENLAVDPEEAESRLQSLAQFQVNAVQHSMTFPNVRRVVYSTCSIHEAENEEVVKEILHNNPDWYLSTALPKWKRRGNQVDGLTPEQTKKLVRCDPKLDQTNGFFVALFERDLKPLEKKLPNQIQLEQNELETDEVVKLKEVHVQKKRKTNNNNNNKPKDKNYNKKSKIKRSVTSG